MTFWTRSPRRASLIGGGLLLATFLTGGLAGAAADRATQDDAGAADCRERRHGRGGGSAWLERLDLSAAQRTEVEAILERRRSQMGAFWREHKHQIHAIVDSTRAEVRAVLTPEQLAEEERIWAERRGREKARESGGSGGK